MTKSVKYLDGLLLMSAYLYRQLCVTFDFVFGVSAGKTLYFILSQLQKGKTSKITQLEISASCLLRSDRKTLTTISAILKYQCY